MKELFACLKDLSELDGISGREDAVRDYILARLSVIRSLKEKGK